MPRGRAGFTLNTDALEQRIMRGATAGARQGATRTMKRAKERAPVRKLFKGTTYRAVSVPGIAGREPISRTVRFRDMTGETRGRNRFGDVRAGRSTGAEFEEFRGHANSLIPLFRRKAGGETLTITGDFRRVNPRDRGFGTLDRLKPSEIEAFTQKGGRVRRQKINEALSGEKLNIGGGRLLKSSGRYEIRSGRADFRDPSSGVVRVGGRLRGEIHVTGPKKAGKGIWFYVVSATKDPETGRLYPRDQEFGTSHHAPHPFLRPALRETRNSFVQAVKRGVTEEMRGR